MTTHSGAPTGEGSQPVDLLGKCDARCPATALVLVEKVARVADRTQVLMLALCGAQYRRHEVALLLDGWHTGRDNRVPVIGAR